MDEIREKIKELNILVAEDDADDFFLLKNRAREQGIPVENIVQVDSVEDARKTIDQGKVDVFLLDLGLRDSVGLETYIKIHQAYNDLPIIVLSGCSDMDIARTAVRLGAQDYIFKKDINHVDLVQTISYTLERSALLLKVKEHSTFKSRFLAQMSHEIRTPMNGVIGLTDILKHSKNLSDEEHEIVEILANSGRHLIELISDILDVSKIESGKMEFDQREFSVRDLVETTMSIFSQAASEKGISMSNLVQPDVPSFVLGDRGRMGQILSNLIGNAIKFTDAGQISVDLKYRKINDRSGVFRFEIVDTGKGISEELRGKLFQDFQQAAFEACDAGMRGTGLGLAICKGLVESMGGTIGVNSTFGRGSTFWFEIELLAKSRKQDLRVESSQKRLLLLGGAKDRLNILSTQIQLRGFKHNSCDLNSMENINIQPDLVILDTKGLNNIEIEASLAKISGYLDQKNPPILLIADRADSFDVSPSLYRTERVTGCLSQAKIYEKVAILLDRRQVTTKAKRTIDHSFGKKFDDLLILVTDDNDVNRKVAVKMLNLLGCRSMTATDGLEAIEAIKNNDFDAVLMDCLMPNMDGFQATKAIRQLEGDKSAIPIFALTAIAYDEDRERAKEVGFDGFIAKPILTSDLESALNGLEKKMSVVKRDTMVVSRKEKTVPRSLGGRDFDEIAKGLQSVEVLNSVTLKSLKELESPDDEGSFLNELIETYIAQAPEAISSLKTAAGEKNIKGIVHYSHKLKGFARNLGATRLSELCDVIEYNAEDAAEIGESELIAALKAEFDSSARQLEAKWMRAV